MTDIVDDRLVYNILRDNSEYFYDKMIIDEHGNEYYMPPKNKVSRNEVSKNIELTFKMINNEIIPFVGSESNISPWLVNNIMDWFRCELVRRFHIILMSESDAINYLGRPLNDKEIQARENIDIDNYIDDINKIGKILSGNSINDARVIFILYTNTNYFDDKMVVDERGNEYYIPPRRVPLTFRMISNEIVPFIGIESNISPWLFDQVMKLYLIEFRWRFNLLRMTESDIINYLGRPLNDKEILAKKDVDDICNDRIRNDYNKNKPAYHRDKVSRDKVSKNKRRRRR